MFFTAACSQHLSEYKRKIIYVEEEEKCQAITTKNIFIIITILLICTHSIASMDMKKFVGERKLLLM